MSDFHAAMKQAKVFALWEGEARHGAHAIPPQAWPWRVMDPLIDGAIAATGMDNAERRVLVLNNPLYENTGLYGATINVAVNLQVLMPGERARVHRHSMSALRFMLEGEGVTTIVEGKPCAMLRGDLVLTPAWTWHEHVHAGQGRAVWVDALDVPLVRYLRDAQFEPGPSHDVNPLPDDAAFAAAGLAPAHHSLAGAGAHSPMFRYPWATARAALDALRPDADGSRLLRYTNPLNGGPVMPTLDCYLLGLAAGRDTTERRSNCNTVCVVVEGTGSSRIGEHDVEWGPNDIFTLPNGSWSRHRASAGGACLFQISDRELFSRMEMLREEVRG